MATPDKEQPGTIFTVGQAIGDYRLFAVLLGMSALTYVQIPDEIRNLPVPEFVHNLHTLPPEMAMLTTGLLGLLTIISGIQLSTDLLVRSNQCRSQKMARRKEPPRLHDSDEEDNVTLNFVITFLVAGLLYESLLQNNDYLFSSQTDGPEEARTMIQIINLSILIPAVMLYIYDKIPTKKND